MSKRIRTLLIVFAAFAAVALAGYAATRAKRADQKPAAGAPVAEFLQNDLYIVEPGALERSLPLTGSTM